MFHDLMGGDMFFGRFAIFCIAALRLIIPQVSDNMVKPRTWISLLFDQPVPGNIWQVEYISTSVA